MDQTSRHQRHRRIRARLRGTAQRPRVSLHRSNRYLTVQLINDDTGTTLAAVSSRGLTGTRIATAAELGAQLAQTATAAGINAVVFDRSGYRYHGRIKALAEALRANGIAV